MTFREQAALDLPAFLNVDEFAETVKVNGEEVACVFDGEGERTASADGVTDTDLILYIRVSDFYKPPRVGDRMPLGEPQEQRFVNVVSVDEQQGMYAIRVREWSS